MSRTIALAALAVAVLAACGCQTTRKITLRSDLTSMSGTRPITVYSEDHSIYQLRDYSLADSTLRGWGTVSKGRQTGTFEGSIPLMSISAVKTDSKSALKGLVVAGLTVAFVAVLADETLPGAGLKATDRAHYYYPYSGGGGGGGESCPYVYSWDGQRYVLEAEPFGVGWGRALELTTVHLLPSARAEGGTVRLRLTNERPETHFVNSLRLVEIDLGEAPGVVLDVDGRPWALANPEAPVAASDAAGRSILADVSSVDSQSWECAPSSLTPGSGYEDVLELAFARPGQATEGTLVLTGINTTFSTVMFQHLCRVVGDQAPVLTHAIETDPVLIDQLKDYLQDASLKVSVWNGSAWEAAGAFLPEANAVTFTRGLRIRVPETGGNTVRVRLRGLADVWKIDALQADWSRASVLPTRPMDLTSAITSEGEDVRHLIQADDRDYAILIPPDQVDLTYATAGRGAPARVAYAVQGRGYLHEWDGPVAGAEVASPIAMVPAERRIDFLKEMLKYREVALRPAYDEWRRLREGRNAE